MTISTLVDLVQINVTSTGTGALALGTAVLGFDGTSALTNGLTYTYSIQQNGNYETGQGVYTAVGATLTRSVRKSSNGGFAIALQAGATVSITVGADDLNALGGGGGGGSVPFRSAIRWTDAAPSALQTIDLWQFGQSVSFAADWADNSGYVRGVAPASDYVITVYLYANASTSSAVAGTITLHADRTITRATVSHAAVVVPAGGALSFVGQSSPGVMTNYAEWFKGTYQ